MAAAPSAVDTTKPEFENWVKACLVLRQLKVGMEGFLEGEMKRIHADYLATVQRQLGTTALACTVCDSQKLGNPRYSCPQGICTLIKQEVESSHMYGKVNLKNTDVTLWLNPTNFWEITKCFLSNGYDAKRSAADTDCPGLLSLVLNCKELHAKMAIDVTRPGNLVTEVRDLRNDVMHSAWLGLPDTDLEQLIRKCLAILNDAKTLKHDPAAQSAAGIVSQIGAGILKVTLVDQLSVLEEARQVTREKIEKLKKGLASVKAQLKTQESRLTTQDSRLTTQETSLKTQESRLTTQESRLTTQETSLKTQESRLTTQESRLTTQETSLKTQESRLTTQEYRLTTQETALKTQGDKLETHETKLKSHETILNTHVETLTAQGTLHESRLTAQESNTEKLETEQGHLKQRVGQLECHKNDTNVTAADETNLQEYLQQRYEDDKTCNVSVLRTYRDIPLLQIFAPIVIREDMEYANQVEGNSVLSVRHGGVVTWKLRETDTTIDSYDDIFRKKGILQRNIYMLGKAGSGKTTFCKHLVDIWCRPSVTGQYEDTEVITGFEFVFLVACRNAVKTDTILDMILDQRIAPEFGHLQPTVKHVLERKPEKCLILIDGLDEWAGSPSKETGPMTPCGLPNRKGLDNCVVLTTSRPWRVETLRQGLGKHPRILDIHGLTEFGMETLSKNLLSTLKVSDEPAALEAFLCDVEGAKMTEMVRTPLMLIIVLTMWQQAQKKLDRSVCVNFSSTLESLIQRAEGESGRSDDAHSLANILQLPYLKKEWKKENRPLPSCFSNMAYCEQYSPLIHKLAKFAFDTLFHETKEKSLVFSIEELEQIFSKTELEVCLKTGVLSLVSTQVESVKRMANVSFMHESLQEYLAALWMVSDKDCLTVFKAYCNCVKDVLDVGNVVSFVSGFSPVKGRELWSCIGEVTRADPVLQEHRQAVASVHRSDGYEDTATQTVIQLQQLSRDCSNEVNSIRPDHSDGQPSSYMVADIYLGHGMIVDQCQLVYDQVLARPSEVKSLIIDNTELAPELEHNLHTLVSLERLHIVLSYRPSVQQCNNLCSGISKLPSIRSLCMRDCWSKTDTVCQLSLACPHMRLLALIGKSSITPRLHMSLPVTMTIMFMESIALSHTSIGFLTFLLRSSSTLQELYIRWLQCFDCGRGECKYDIDLTKHSQLERLEVEDKYHDVGSVRVSPDMTRLRNIVMCDLQMPPEAWTKFICSLPRLAHGLTVKLYRVDIDPNNVSYIESNFTVTINFELIDRDRVIEFCTEVAT